MSNFVNPNKTNNPPSLSKPVMKQKVEVEGKTDDYWGSVSAGVVFGGVGVIILTLMLFAMIIPLLGVNNPTVVNVNVQPTDLTYVARIVKIIQQALFIFIAFIAFLHVSGLMLALVGLGAKYDKRGVQRKRSTSVFMILWCSAFLSLMVLHAQNFLQLTR